MDKELSKKAVDELSKVFETKEFKSLIDSLQKADIEETGEFEVVISTDDEDRGGDIVVQSGIKTDNYMKNPVVLVNHDYWGLPAGVTDSLRMETDDVRTKTIAKGRFAPTEMGQTLRKLYDAKMLHATSIGFRVLERDEDGKIVRWELLEWSWVSVPMNQNAVVSLVGEKMFKSLSDLGIIKSDVTIEEEDEEEVVEVETPEEIETADTDLNEIEEVETPEVEEVEETDEEDDSEDEKALSKIESLEKTIKDASIVLEALKKEVEDNKPELEETEETEEQKQAGQFLAFQKACKNLTVTSGEKALQKAVTEISNLLHEIKKNR